MILDEQAQAYKRDGVIVVPEVLNQETLGQVRTVLAELVAGAAAVTEHTDVYDLEPGHTPDNPRVRRIKAPQKVHPIFDEIVRSPAVISILTKLIGLGPSPARLQAQHEVGTVRLAGRVASGLGVLSAHQ